MTKTSAADTKSRNHIGEENLTRKQWSSSIMYALVLDKNKKPLDPTHPAQARKMLKAGRAKVFRR
ncbi:RRXRR domain-containing protein, partial [Geitlerinema sp. PCC 9228]|uniref:RRXRR domain-containing protein n=1 Tax=Geitlerinema sp. PCC 9228 TaxID=111611 RepID=UPI001FCDE48D